jgi:hypothetical protein
MDSAYENARVYPDGENSLDGVFWEQMPMTARVTYVTVWAYIERVVRLAYRDHTQSVRHLFFWSVRADRARLWWRTCRTYLPVKRRPRLANVSEFCLSLPTRQGQPDPVTGIRSPARNWVSLYLWPPLLDRRSAESRYVYFEVGESMVRSWKIDSSLRMVGWSTLGESVPGGSHSRNREPSGLIAGIA